MQQDPAFSPPKIEPMHEPAGMLDFVRAVVANPVAGIPKSAYEQPITVAPFAPRRIAFVSCPDLLEEILVRRVEDFPKSEVDDRILRPAFGEGLLLAHGDSWRWKRRLAAPVFAPSALAGAAEAMASPFAELTERWTATNGTHDHDMVPAMTRATLEVLDRVLFSGDGEIDTAAITDAIDDYLEPVSWIVAYASLRVPRWVPFPGSGRMHRARNRMRAEVSALIDKRRAAGARSDDLCGRLMHATDPETGRPLGDEDLVDMLLTLIAAGHETSANALSWAIYCLTAMPAMQERLAVEARAAAGNGTIGAENLPMLDLTRAFLCETMRLFPPAPLMARRTTRPETLGGIDLDEDAVVFVPPYAVHRHATLWDDPDTFRIERFLGGADKSLPRTAYMPFGAGPRICVGGSFAMMEMTAGLATLLRTVRFRAVDGFTPTLRHQITLRPGSGLPVGVEAA